VYHKGVVKRPNYKLPPLLLSPSHRCRFFALIVALWLLSLLCICCVIDKFKQESVSQSNIERTISNKKILLLMFYNVQFEKSLDGKTETEKTKIHG